MRKQSIVLSLVVLAMLGGIRSSFGQARGQDVASDKYPSLKVQAQDLADAVLNKNFEKIVEFTHPTVVAFLGGREKMIATIKQTFENSFDKDGVTLLGFRYGEIEQEVKVDNSIFAVLAEVVRIQIKDTKYEADSSEIAVSADGGKNWKFVSGTTGQELFNKMFPKTADKIKVKGVGAPRKVD